MPKRTWEEWEHTVRFTDKSFNPIALALGQLTLAWNDLQLTFSALFCGVMGGKDLGLFLGVWGCIKSDRHQRDALLEATRLYKPLDEFDRRATTFYEEIKWVVDNANRLEDTRNDVLHSPLWGVRAENKIVVNPLATLGNKRARKLRDKNLLEEFRHFRDTASVLRNYGSHLEMVLSCGTPWRGRPKLPTLELTKKRSRRRPERKEERPPQREPSGE